MKELNLIFIILTSSSFWDISSTAMLQAIKTMQGAVSTMPTNQILRTASNLISRSCSNSSTINSFREGAKEQESESKTELEDTWSPTAPSTIISDTSKVNQNFLETQLNQNSGTTPPLKKIWTVKDTWSLATSPSTNSTSKQFPNSRAFNHKEIPFELRPYVYANGRFLPPKVNLTTKDHWSPDVKGSFSDVASKISNYEGSQTVDWNENSSSKSDSSSQSDSSEKAEDGIRPNRKRIQQTLTKMQQKAVITKPGPPTPHSKKKIQFSKNGDHVFVNDYSFNGDDHTITEGQNISLVKQDVNINDQRPSQQTWISEDPWSPAVPKISSPTFTSPEHSFVKDQTVKSGPASSLVQEENVIHFSERQDPSTAQIDSTGRDKITPSQLQDIASNDSSRNEKSKVFRNRRSLASPKEDKLLSLAATIPELSKKAFISDDYIFKNNEQNDGLQTLKNENMKATPFPASKNDIIRLSKRDNAQINSYTIDNADHENEILSDKTVNQVSPPDKYSVFEKIPELPLATPKKNDLLEFPTSSLPIEASSPNYFTQNEKNSPQTQTDMYRYMNDFSPSLPFKNQIKFPQKYGALDFQTDSLITDHLTEMNSSHTDFYDRPPQNENLVLKETQSLSAIKNKSLLTFPTSGSEQPTNSPVHNQQNENEQNIFQRQERVVTENSSAQLPKKNRIMFPKRSRPNSVISQNDLVIIDETDQNKVDYDQNVDLTTINQTEKSEPDQAQIEVLESKKNQPLFLNEKNEPFER